MQAVVAVETEAVVSGLCLTPDRPFLPLRQSPGGGGGGLPLTNLVVWLKADSLALTDGATVSSWTDSSGNGNSASQANASLQPVYHTNVVNGLPALQCSSFGDQRGMSTPYSRTSGQDFTVIAVYESTIAPGTANQRAVQGSVNWLIGPYGSSYQTYAGSFAVDGAIVQNQWVVHSAVQSGNTLTSQFVNGAAGGTIPSPTSPGTFGISTVGAFAETLQGNLAEVLIYSVALDSTTRGNAESYLRSKYGF